MIIITAIYHVSGPLLNTFPYIISCLPHNVSVRELLSPFHAVETRTQVGTEFGSVPTKVPGILALVFLVSEPELPFNHYTVSLKKTLERCRLL